VATSAALAAVLADLDRERTLTGRDCLVADRAPFGGLVPDRRLIVLTAEEREVLWQRFFGYCELALPLFVLDRSGHRGFAIWVHSGQAGGTIRLEESLEESLEVERLGNCNGGFGELPRLARVYEKELDLPPEVALALARATRDSHEAVDKRVRERRMPAIEAMRGMESQFLLLLDMEPERAALVDEVADFYASWNLGLGSPAPALLERVARARDPIALASRLAERSTWSGDDPFYTEVFLAAATARPDAPGLWQQAARFARSPGVKAALFEQAYRVYLGPRAAAPGPAEVPVALALAGQWLKAELDNGLAAEAVATFHALPPALRRALAAGTIPWIMEKTIPGMDFSHTDEDLRLPLAAACLLTGDRATAGELLAGTAQWPGNEDRSADILYQSLAHDPRGQEDPFELFVRTLGREPFDVPPAVGPGGRPRDSRSGEEDDGSLPRRRPRPLRRPRAGPTVERALGGGAEDGLAGRALRAGAAALLPRPLRPARLRRVERLLLPGRHDHPRGDGERLGRPAGRHLDLVTVGPSTPGAAQEWGRPPPPGSPGRGWRRGPRRPGGGR
jgi:hypothetical protein